MTRVLVLVPTRELGIQVHSVTKQLAQFSSITTCLAVGEYKGEMCTSWARAALPALGYEGWQCILGSHCLPF